MLCDSLTNAGPTGQTAGMTFFVLCDGSLHEGQVLVSTSEKEHPSVPTIGSQELAFRQPFALA